MSGSPPLPPKAARDSAERAQQAAYQAYTSQDVHREIPTSTTNPGDTILQTPTEVPLQGVTFSAAESTQDRMLYALPRAEPPTLPPLSYAQHGQTARPQPQYAGPSPGSRAGSSQAGPAYPGSSTRPASGSQEHSPQSSPKLQRKTKGHVASACVPCKRAHLRCDAQRPCSRCLSNGKEDACVDVQHKKRGRPRLRDDRDARYDQARYGSPQEAALRRPMPPYGSGLPPGPAYDENLRRAQSQSYRVIKSQPSHEPLTPRYLEWGSPADANVYPAPLSISTRAPEPAAFLTMDMEIAKASTTFSDALARPTVKGLRLTDFIVAADREKVNSLQRQMQDEQARREPTYLPPIFGKQEEDRVLQAQGFAADEMSRYQLDRHEHLTFLTQDGQPRPFPIRVGLAKRESIYFVVVMLSLVMTSHQQHPTPSPLGRDVSYSYHPLGQPYSHPTPVSATFDPRAPPHRLGESSGYGSGPSRQSSVSGQGAAGPGLSPGVPSSYTASPSRPEYSPLGTGQQQPSYQVGRSELTPVTRAPGQPSASGPAYQLPPIRSQHQQLLQPQPHPPQQLHLTQSAPTLPSDPSPPGGRDDGRSSRVDIGGLIDRPEQPKSQP